MGWEELAREDRAREWERERAELEVRELVESPEAEEARWRGVFAAMPEHVRRIEWGERPWLARRWVDREVLHPFGVGAWDD